MKYLFIILISFLVFSGSCESDNDEKNCFLEENSQVIPSITKILFIGNSHTYVNEIPVTVRQMANLSGDSTFIRQEAPGGMTLEEHSLSAQTLDAISAEKWDVVVLQGSGWKNALPTNMAESSVYPYAQIVIDSIRSSNGQTRIVCYMTHGYKNGVLSFGDEVWCEQDPLVCDYQGMQARIKDNYVEMIKRFSSELAPAGILWKIFMVENPDVVLYSTDGIHATPEGSYLSACTLYSLIFRKSPIGRYHPEEIGNDVSSTIQVKVYEVLFKCNPDWKLY